jgi:hypothetical protein
MRLCCIPKDVGEAREERVRLCLQGSPGSHHRIMEVPKRRRMEANV